MNRVDNLSLGPFVSRMFWALTGTASGSSADWTRRAAVAVADIVVLGMTIRATLADANHRDPDWRIYSLWIATSIMLSPVGWHHYLVLLAIPFVQMVASAADGRSSTRAVWMAALSYVLSAVSLRVFNRFLIPPPTEFQLIFPWLARALGDQLHRLTDGIHRDVLVRDGSRPPVVSWILKAVRDYNATPSAVRESPDSARCEGADQRYSGAAAVEILLRCVRRWSRRSSPGILGSC